MCENLENPNAESCLSAQEISVVMKTAHSVPCRLLTLYQSTWNHPQTLYFYYPI